MSGAGTRGRPPAKPFSRWTEDTETAFLLALRLTGQARRAAAEIGRSLASAYTRRRRDPAFAARWDAVVAEQQREWAERAASRPSELPIGRERFDGWTPLRRRAFLRALSETGEVAAACRRVRISTTAAYGLRERSAAFAEAWDRALEQSVPMLEQVAWERAVEGWEEEIVAGGKVVGTRRRYSEALLKALLARADRADSSEETLRADDLILPKGVKREGNRIVFDRIDRERLEGILLRKLEAVERQIKADEAKEIEGTARAALPAPRVR